MQALSFCMAWIDTNASSIHQPKKPAVDGTCTIALCSLAPWSCQHVNLIHVQTSFLVLAYQNLEFRVFFHGFQASWEFCQIEHLQFPLWFSLLLQGLQCPLQNFPHQACMMSKTNNSNFQATQAKNEWMSYLVAHDQHQNAHQCCHAHLDVAHILQKLTTRPQKCDTEVLPLPGANSTVQTSQRLEQKLHINSQLPCVCITPLIGCLVSWFSLRLTLSSMGSPNPPLLGTCTFPTCQCSFNGQQTKKQTTGIKLMNTQRGGNVADHTMLCASYRNWPPDCKSVMQRCCPSSVPTQLSRHHSGQSRNYTWTANYHASVSLETSQWYPFWPPLSRNALCPHHEFLRNLHGKSALGEEFHWECFCWFQVFSNVWLRTCNEPHSKGLPIGKAITVFGSTNQ